MILQLSITNFLSYRDTQVFSLLASHTEKQNPNAVSRIPIPGLKGEATLKGAAIFGGNASGKSNFFAAMGHLRHMVIMSENDFDKAKRGKYLPFFLDKENKTEPTRFELDFTIGESRYNYVVSFDNTHIVEESLAAYPNGRKQEWFSRTYIRQPSGKKKPLQQWKFGSQFDKSDAKLKDRTRDEVPFLAVAGQWNHPQLKIIRDWFESDLELGPFDQDYTLDILEDPSRKPEVLSLLKWVDPNIIDIKSESEDIPIDDPKLPKNLSLLLSMAEKKSFKSRKVEFIVAGENGTSFSLPSKLVSGGTRRHLALLGPILDILRRGSVLFFDELESSLHPLLVFEIVKLFMSEKTNPKGAQIIFSTHLTTLLSATIGRTSEVPLLRRDQIWFTQKAKDGATSLYPLTKFSPRQKEALERGYYSGRYGGISLFPKESCHG